MNSHFAALMHYSVVAGNITSLVRNLLGQSEFSDTFLEADPTPQAMNVLQVREKYQEQTMAQFYGPDKIPFSLRAARQALDLTVDRLYQKAPFTSDEERLEHLFKRYEAMIAKEQKGKK